MSNPKNKAKKWVLTPGEQGNAVDKASGKPCKHVYPLIGLEDVCMKCYKIRGKKEYMIP